MLTKLPYKSSNTDLLKTLGSQNRWWLGRSTSPRYSEPTNADRFFPPSQKGRKPPNGRNKLEQEICTPRNTVPVATANYFRVQLLARYNSPSQWHVLIISKSMLPEVKAFVSHRESIVKVSESQKGVSEGVAEFKPFLKNIPRFPLLRSPIREDNGC